MHQHLSEHSVTYNGRSHISKNMIHIFLLLFRHSAFGAVVQSSYTDLILNQNWVYTPYMEEYFWTQTLDSLSPDTRRTINLNVRLDNTQQNNTLAAFVSATCVEISPKSDCFKDGSSVVFARICNGTTLRIPRTETWDFWTALEQYDRVVNPPRPWNSIDFKSLKSELVNNQRGKLYFLDGIRKAYLDIPLTSELTHSIDQWFKISKNSSLSICLRNPSQQVRLGDFKARKRKPPPSACILSSTAVAIIPSSNTFTETRMRVFFDPGWRFTTYISKSSSSQTLNSVRGFQSNGRRQTIDQSFRVQRVHGTASHENLETYSRI